MFKYASLKFFCFFVVNCIVINSAISERNEVETLKIVINSYLPAPTKWDKDKINSFGNHKTLLGFLHAYFDHCPIKLSPNVIWQLILNAFSEYVNTNSELLRKIFVKFEEKKQLIFHRLGTLDDIHQYEESIIEELCQKISEEIGDELINILTPNFTTSTNQTIIAGKVSIMSTFKPYFHYGGVMHVCGIPYIILEGKLEDWEKILQKLNHLSKFLDEKKKIIEEEKNVEDDVINRLKLLSFYNKENEFNVDKIKKNIEEIIKTKKGNINIDFWKNIIMETNVTSSEEVGVYEYVEVQKKVIRGWICDFYPTMKRDVEKNSNDLVDEILEVPLKVMQSETEGIRDYKIFAGITDLKQDPDTFLVEPIVNFTFSVDNSNDNKYDWIPNDL